MIFAFGCISGPSPLQVHPKGPRMGQAVVPVFLKYSLSTAKDHGPVALTLAAPVSLTTGQQIPKGALLEGHYQTNYEHVLFAPAFMSYYDSAEQLQRVSLNSNQLGRLDMQSATNPTQRIQKWFSPETSEVSQGTVFFLDFRL